MQHCGFCGGLINQAVEGWPRPCLDCGKLTYNSPKPVVVLAVRTVEGGILTIKRGIEPGKGGWAFPGGYVDHMEPWRDAAVREACEELGVTLYADKLTLRHVATTDSNHLVLCVEHPPLIEDTWRDHDLSTTLNDTGEQEILGIWCHHERPTNLAFSSHRAFAAMLMYTR